MDWNYEPSLKLTLQYEGGYSNHPSDPGGPTKYGITIHDARAYWKRDASAADVKAMPLSVAKEIYRTKYWAKVGGDELPAGVDFATFDFGVNSGVSRALTYLRSVDTGTPVQIVKKLCGKRLGFLHGLRTWGTFGPGWGKRVANVEANGVKMALQGQGVPADAVKRKLEQEATAAAEQRKQDTTKTVGTGGGGAATTQAPSPDAAPAPTPGATEHLDASWLDTFWHYAPYALGAALLMAALYFGYRAYTNHVRAQAYTEAANG